MKEEEMNVRDIVDLQVRSLRAFERVAGRCTGLVNTNWIAGEGRTFDTPYRRFGDVTRPGVLSLEVTSNGGLILSLSICRPENGVPVFETYGKWDFWAPISKSGRGPQLNLNKPKHRLNVKRACDMLHKLCDFGYSDKRGENPQLDPCRWPDVLIPFSTGSAVIDEDKLTALAIQKAPAELIEQMREQLRVEYVRQNGATTLVNAAIVPDNEVAAAVRQDRALEDYTPVLGAADRNTLSDISHVQVYMPNPASKILARRGLEEINNHTAQWVVDEISTEIRLTMPDIVLSEEETAEAILNPNDPMAVSVDIKTAMEQMPDAAEAALRFQASKRSQREATRQELFTAVANPGKPIVLRRLSAIQLNTVEEWQNTPAPYAGSILSPLKFAQAARINAQTQTTPEHV
jgi:hypothetical protein